MVPLKTALIAALVAGLLTAGALFRVQRNRAREAAQLRHANTQMRYQANLRSQSPAPAPIRDVSTNPEPAPANIAPPPAPPASDYRDEGQATPQATLQTFAFACARGDSATVEKLLWFEGAARKKALAFMATLPEQARSAWASPEAMAANLLVADAAEHPFPTATILEKATPAPLTNERILLELPGAGPLHEHTEYQKFGDKWKYVVTESMVNAYVERASDAR